MPKTNRAILIILMMVASGTSSWAQDNSRAEMRALDEQVQEIKSDVLGIAAELSTLEEHLLYPSNTQLAIFVSLASGEDFRLDAVQIQIDGELSAHYIYSFKELEALQEGGVQRIYTGNVPTGSHELAVSVTGKSQTGREFSRSESFTFNKGINPRLIGLTLAGPDSGLGAIRLGDW
jgi:hypothetical protein